MEPRYDWQNELSSDEHAQIKHAIKSFLTNRKHDAPADLDSMYEHVLADFECNDEKLHTDHHTAIREAVSFYSDDQAE